VRKRDGVTSSGGETGAGGVSEVSVVGFCRGKLDRVHDGKEEGKFSLSDIGSTILKVQVTS